jgi:hypothetical protein
MRDARARLEKLLTDAEECDLISKLATNDPKRATFAKVAAEYRKMARELKTLVVKNAFPEK